MKLQLFETLWKQSISALEVIKKLEENIQPEITSKLGSRESKCMLFKLITNSKYRIDMIIPTAGCFQCLAKGKLISHLENALNQGVKVRILLPSNDNALELLKHLNRSNFEIKEVNDIHAKRIVLVADSHSSLSIAVSQSENEGIRTRLWNGIFSTSPVTLMTFSVLFEKMWS